MGGDTDGDAGSFISPECPGHRHYIGGGKPPPPLMPPMRHAGDLASNEQAATFHHPVRQGGGEESPTDGGRGDVGDLGEGLPGLCKTA